MCSNIETGFTKFDNKVLAFLYTTNLNRAEYRVLIFIFRHTIGFHRKSHELSGSYISAGTGLPIRTVERAIGTLRDKKIILTRSEKSQPNVITLNINLLGISTVTNDGDEETDTVTSGGESPSFLAEQVPSSVADKERNRERKIKEREGTPTLDDVISYCQQMSFTFSPERFFNYYEALGWQKNGQPILNWKAIARNWQARERVQPVQVEVEKDDWGRPIPPKYV